MDKTQFINDMLLLPATAMDYMLGQRLREYFPQKGILETDNGLCNVEAYAYAGHCTLERRSDFYQQYGTFWMGPGPERMHWRHMARGMYMSGPVVITGGGMPEVPAVGGKGRQLMWSRKPG